MIRDLQRTLALTARVGGVPQPQGSIRSLGKGRPSVHANAARLDPWRDTIVVYVRNAMKRGVGPWPIDGPVRLEALFRMPRPRSRPADRPHPTSTPDLSHLLRACEDGIGMAGAWVDDAQIIEVEAAERYGDPGCVLWVYRLNAAKPWYSEVSGRATRPTEGTP